MNAHLSIAVLEPPRRSGTTIEKGALVANHCDLACRLIPGLRQSFYLIERRGWVGMNDQATADVKLVDDLRTLDKMRERFPRAIILEYANADFVDTDLFRPLGTTKKYAGIQISAWERFKRHKLFVEAAALLPDRQFVKFGHFWDQDGLIGMVKARLLRNRTIHQSQSLGAHIDFPFSGGAGPGDPVELNRIINKARLGILTTTIEGVNRFKMECLAADIPVLMPLDASEPTKKYIVPETGLLFEPTPRGLADAIIHAERTIRLFSPRQYLLAHSGIHHALPRLKEALRQLAMRDGMPADRAHRRFEHIYWNGRNQGLTWGKRGIEEVSLIVARMGIR